MTAAGRRAVSARISGKVQGVWYRAWTCERAAEHGLDGWVRNRRDGTVEALFAGPADAVERMIAACREGPPAAVVAEVAVADAAEAPTAGSGFAQRPTE